MKPGDISIWERFIRANPTAYDFVYYDFWVGSPPPFNPIVNDETEGSADGLYRRKIDVVAHRGSSIDIIELKPRAGMSAIGQVKGYVSLYVRDERPLTMPRAIIITDQLSDDVRHVSVEQRVIIIVA